MIGGITLLGEQLTLQIALGGAVVIAGLAFILFERAPATKQPVDNHGETPPARKPEPRPPLFARR